MAKEYFTKNNVKFEEFNVAEDDAAREEMIQKSQQLGVPVIFVNDEVFVGFDRKGLARALALPN
jgi:glutaredoxin